MATYKFINLDNGNILLEKVNNEDINNEKIFNIKNVNDIKNFDIRKSTIISCIVNNDKILKLKYKTVKDYIYNIINDGSKIIKYTKLNIKTIKKIDDGFVYLENLGISVQGVDSNKCLLEIVNQCFQNKITLDMKIKLRDESFLQLNF